MDVNFGDTHFIADNTRSRIYGTEVINHKLMVRPLPYFKKIFKFISF